MKKLLMNMIEWLIINNTGVYALVIIVVKTAGHAGQVHKNGPLAAFEHLHFGALS